MLGGWFEIDGAATTSDEMLGWAPIAKDVASYDASLYDSAAVSVLLTRRRAAGTGPWAWTMPDASVATPFYPVAEVLSDDGAVLLLKWRDVYAPGGAPTPVYQRARYLLEAGGLKVRWGAFAATPGAAVAPPLGPADPCNDADVICYDHQHQPGY
jgi:hypothetical protein